MRYLIPAIALASPALAHPAQIQHTHGTDWAVPVALVLIASTIVVLRRWSVRARADT